MTGPRGPVAGQNTGSRGAVRADRYGDSDMPILGYQQLQQIGVAILRATGTPQHDAELVAEELAEANLCGHDSHGIIRLKQYVDYIEEGVIRPGTEVEVEKDFPAVALINGGGNFGQVVARKALTLAMERARQSAGFSVFCRDSNHVGRLGSYARRAALEGFVAVTAVNGPGVGGGVVPWGAIERRMGTNPISIGAPWKEDALVLDMTTSATAEGKVRVALQRGGEVPEGWIIDGEGNPSTNPADLYGDPDAGVPRGGILPLGGPMGFKGYGLGVMVDVLCGILSGAGLVREDLPPGTNGIWMYLLDTSQLQQQDYYANILEKYVTWIKGARRGPQVDEILMPGEIEQQRYAQRQRDGVDVPDGTWQQTSELAERLGVQSEACFSAP